MTSEKNPLSKKTGTLQIRSLHDIPELYSNNRTKNPVAYARFQAPWLKKSWYVFEWSRKDSFFGLEANEVTGRRLYGLYSLEDLSKLRGPFDMCVMQDHAFRVQRLSELRRGPE